MKKLTYRYELLLLALWLPSVLLLFRVIPEKRVAAVIAGIGFIILPILFLLKELSENRKSPSSKVQIVICVEFLIVSALPIFLLRLLNWDSEFSTLSLFGISASALHGFSNLNYLVVVASTSYLAHREWRNEKSQPRG